MKVNVKEALGNPHWIIENKREIKTFILSFIRATKNSQEDKDNMSALMGILFMSCNTNVLLDYYWYDLYAKNPTDWFPDCIKEVDKKTLLFLFSELLDEDRANKIVEDIFR